MQYQPYLLEYVEKERAGIERDSATIGNDIENERAGVERNSSTIEGDMENERVRVKRDNTIVGADIENERGGVERDNTTVGADIENKRVRAEIDNKTFDRSDFHDSEYDVEEDEKYAEWAGVTNIGKGVEKEKSTNHGHAKNDGVESDYGPPDELLSIDDSSSDEDSTKRRMPKFVTTQTSGKASANASVRVGKCVQSHRREKLQVKRNVIPPTSSQQFKPPRSTPNPTLFLWKGQSYTTLASLQLISKRGRIEGIQIMVA
ncbi:unnamed protein product [Ilex paraguariensis]|uniref:Uncharacterized protein n=1 Tax=Ilex paraguariensis TaxID=185542 RepID=A0ABC8RT03_9AQUA